MSWRLPLAVIVCLALLPFPAAARSAADRKVEALVKEAQALYEKGDFRKSAETLLRAYEIKPLPKLLFNVARTWDKAGDEDNAIRYYQRYIDTGADADLVRKASNAVDRLKSARAAREADEEARRQAELKKADDARREAETARLAAEKAEAEAKARAEKERQDAAQAALKKKLEEESGPSPAAYVLGGVAVAGVATGVVFGLRARSFKSDFDGSRELGQKQTLMESAKSNALIADVAFGAAGAAAIGAAVVYILTSGTEAEPAASVALSPSGGSLSLAWGF